MITIVGAGPAGSYAAYLLAKKGKNVRVLEEHKTIGEPVQCTGIVTKDILRYLNPWKGVIINKTQKVLFVAGRKRLILSNENLIINRTAFDKQIATMAKRAGATYSLSTKVKEIFKENQNFTVITNKGLSKSKWIIGADGPLSLTARQLDLYKNQQFFKTKQVLADFKNDNVIEFHLLKKGFAWIVPESKSNARIGVATMSFPSVEFNDFTNNLKIEKVHMTNGGLIPIFHPAGFRQKGLAFLIGDAGGFVKQTTGGGIVQALESARIASQSILHGPRYFLLWNLLLTPGLLLHKLVYKIMHSKNNEELLKLLNQKRVKKILSNVSRDNLVVMAIQLAFAEPRLFKFLI